jgi:ABC-type Fe3+-hydroxamate transport system substrate-binding protein
VRIIDDRGAAIELHEPPQRVVSLVPSTTETLFDLGLPPVGVTRYCVHPAAGLADLPRVGGTKDVVVERVRALRPDLIVGNCEENTREIFAALEPIAPVYAAFPRTVDDALADLLRLGALLGRHEQAQAWAERIGAERAALRALPPSPERVAYLIWRKPYMAVSGDTFIGAMLREAGLHNVFEQHPERFPVIEPHQIAAAAPNRVLLSSEPFPFRATHAAELAEATGLPGAAFAAADGELCSWHGTRLVLGLAALRSARLEGWPALA